MQPDEESGTRCTSSRLCVECGGALPEKKGSGPKPKYCPECKESIRRAKVRLNVQACRQRVVGGEEHDENEDTMKDIPLICGHKTLLRIQPIEGEMLWCVRCDDWREFTNGVKRPLCPSGTHRMTPFNTVIHPDTGRNVCRRCLQDELGRTVMPGVNFPTGRGKRGASVPKNKRNSRGPKTTTHPPAKKDAPVASESEVGSSRVG